MAIYKDWRGLRRWTPHCLCMCNAVFMRLVRVVLFISNHSQICGRKKFPKETPVQMAAIQVTHRSRVYVCHCHHLKYSSVLVHVKRSIP